MTLLTQLMTEQEMNLTTSVWIPCGVRLLFSSGDMLGEIDWMTVEREMQ